MHRQRWLTVAGALLIVLPGTGCTDSQVAAPFDARLRVTIAQRSIALDALGEEATLSASVTNGSGRGTQTVVWSSLNPQIVTVSQAGQVVARARGEARVVAAVGTASDTAVVTVTQAAASLLIRRSNAADPAPPAGAPRSPVAEFDALGDAVRLDAIVRDRRGHAITDAAVRWVSLDTAVVRALQDGTVLSWGEGDSYIVATTGALADTAPVKVKQAQVRLEVSPRLTRLTALGDTVVLRASSYDRNGRQLKTTNASWVPLAAGGVLNVNSTGRAQALGNGVVRVVASSGVFSDTAVITVEQEVTRVATAPAALALAVGSVAGAAAAGYDRNGHAVAAAPIMWRSANTQIAVVDAGGRVLGLSPGTTTITATSGDYSAAVQVTVEPAPVASVTVAPATFALEPGATRQLTATTRDAADNTLTGRVVTWSSSNAAVATVSSSGLVTGIAAGAAVITASSEGRTASATVTVSTAVASVAVQPTAVTLAPGASQQLTALVYAGDGSVIPNAAIVWTSNNPAAATVSSTGMVSAVAAGSAVVTASCEGRTAVVSVTVTNVSAPPPPSSPPPPTVATVTVSPASVSLQTGQTSQLSATARDANGNVLSGQTFSWASSNAQVATVSASGVVTGVAAGTAVITATAGGRSGSASVTVAAPSSPPPTVASVTVSPASVSLQTGQAGQLTATARDANGNVLSGQTFTWASGNAQVATVSASGVVTGVAAGTAVITATAGGRSGSANVSVSAPSTPPPSDGTRTVLFASDWSTEQGTSMNARTDGGRWNIIGDPGVGLASVSCTSLGFPTPNCLRVTAVETAGGFARLARTGLPIPANGESVYYRWYYRSEIPLTGDNSTHPVESGNTGGLDWMFNVQVQSNTTWYPEFRPGGNQTDVNRARWTGPLLNNGVTYRFELQIHKLSNTDFQAHIRVYDAAGTLIASDADFNNYRGGLYPSVRMSLADNPTLRFSTNGGLNLQEYRAGINSLVTSGYGSRLFAYQGGFAVCRGSWCGPYVTGEGR